jgi:hypothetical protein
MALFPEMTTYYKGRTHTSLVVSEGNAPAEKYLPSATEAVKFQYAFGPEGNQGVVIPKGKVVAAAGLEWDYETEHNVPAIKIADGTTDSILGVNHHNVYERVRDRFSGNQPTVITREYIEVPLFGDKDFAKNIQFGAAWVGGAANNLEAANAMFGKKIAVDEHGNYTVAAAGTYDNIIGTCYGVETDVPPAGYLQYFMEMDDARWAEFVKQMSFAPSPGRTKDADPFDVGTYPLGSSYLKDKKDLIKNFQAGIPFLTDGYFKARASKTYNLDTADVVVNTSGHVTVAGANVTCTDPVGAALFIKLPKAHKLVNEVLKVESDEFPEFANGPVPAGVGVTIDGVAVSAANVHVDYTNNMVVVYLTETIDVAAPVVVSATVLENQIPGIPTGWDFKGAYGAVRILLQK